MNKFSFSDASSFHPNRFRRCSTSLSEIPCLMSVSSQSSGTVPSSSFTSCLPPQNYRDSVSTTDASEELITETGDRLTFHHGFFF